jgi:hypothetical protein
MKALFPPRRGLLGCLAFLTGTLAILAFAQTRPSALAPVSKAMLCVTEGKLSEAAPSTLSVAAPKMRAYVNANTLAEAQLRFTYLGPTDKDIPLGSGEMRRQFGLKLLAQDACNLVYVMWRFEPQSKIVVSVKSNPGQHTSAECGNRGYTNVKPRRGLRVPAISVGSSHTLQAMLGGEDLRVVADGAAVWEGSIGGDASRLKGPVGIRSDNARLNFHLMTAAAQKQAGTVPACREEPGE